MTRDGRFEIRGSGRTWTLDATNDTDSQELIRRKIPVSYRSLADAHEWLYGSVYEHGAEPWPSGNTCRCCGRWVGPDYYAAKREHEAGHRAP